MTQCLVNERSPSPAAGNAFLGRAIQIHLGHELRSLYGDPAEEKLPVSLSRLLNRVAQIIRAHTEPVNRTFVDELMGSLKSLRAFAISLTRDIHRAEVLAQETVLKAISKQDKFEAGTNLQAWLFTILRNLNFSAHRKTQREVEDADGIHAATIPDQEDRLAVQDLHAAILDTKVGTIKSRVNRARNRLAELMGFVHKDGIAGAYAA
jgi:RNA polymerase sigma-70 factor (ECF subfamily)